MSQHLHFSHPDRFSPFNLSDLSPGSPDSITMPSPGGAIDLAMHPFAQYTALPAQNQNQSQSKGQALSAAQSIADLQALAGHGQRLPLLPNSGLMLTQFIADNGPWNPLSLDPGHGQLPKKQPDAAPFSRQFNFGIDYRNPVPPPSEADTVGPSGGLLSDSGYGSMAAKQSVGNRSVYNGDADLSFETQSLASQFQRMSHRTALPTEEHRKREAIAQRSASGATNSKVLVCPECNVTLKTNSELNKHRARHDRPFKCTVAKCPKATEGFSTNNDLDRHKRCVHKMVVGVETFYRCDIDQCREKLKNWPRQDNFRQHLKRKHHLENVDLAPFTFQTSGLNDGVEFRPSAAISSTASTILSHYTPSPSQWTAVNHPTHVSPASLMNGNRGVGHHGLPNMAYENHRTSNADASQYMAQQSSENTRAQMDMEPALNGLSMPPPSQRATTPISELLSGFDQPPFVAPHLLRQTGTEAGTISLSDIRLQTGSDQRWWAGVGPRPQAHETMPKKEIPLEIDDASEASEDLEEAGAQSVRDEIEFIVSDAMDVDDPVQDSMSLVESQDSEEEEGGDEDDEPLDETPDIHASVELSSIQEPQEPDAQVKASPPEPQPEPQPSVDTPQPIDLNDDLQAEAFLRSLMEGGKLKEKLKKLGITLPDEEEPKDDKLSIESSAASDSGPADSGPVENGRASNDTKAINDTKTINKCDQCPKTFTRRCELKKHQKRHAKPYHCTYANCEKSFGSKNDWKRHENSQHYQLEIWRCAERAADNLPQCGKVCHRRESLQAHLRKDHGIHDLVVLDKKLADCRMGRNFGSRFWCGFCQITIEPTGRAAAHSERFDHIDAHFNGKGMPKADIRDWKHVDADPSEFPDLAVMAARASGEKGNARKRGHDGEGSDSKAKRRKEGGGSEEYWVCCFCQQYSRVDPEDKAPAACVGGCNHKQCDECEWFTSNPSDEPGVFVQQGGAGGAGGAGVVEKEQKKEVSEGEKGGEGQGGKEGAKEREVVVLE